MVGVVVDVVPEHLSWVGFRSQKASESGGAATAVAPITRRATTAIAKVKTRLLMTCFPFISGLLLWIEGIDGHLVLDQEDTTGEIVVHTPQILGTAPAAQ